MDTVWRTSRSAAFPNLLRSYRAKLGKCCTEPLQTPRRMRSLGVFTILRNARLWVEQEVECGSRQGIARPSSHPSPWRDKADTEAIRQWPGPCPPICYVNGWALVRRKHTHTAPEHGQMAC